ncbi:MAG: hypothetical protein H0W62_12125 [Chitinophagales bacterium]|nr:hypothetical protein [Chitinophagales bacterium]
MRLSIFLLVTALASFVFGAVMFFIPSFPAGFLSIETTPPTLSVLRGMGGLIIVSGAITISCVIKTIQKLLKHFY